MLIIEYAVIIVNSWCFGLTEREMFDRF